MSDKHLDADGQSLNIDQLIADFKARTEAGEPFPFEKFIAAHPEHTDELTRYFKQWNEVEAPPQPDKAGADKSSTGTSKAGKISVEDATAHTVVQVSGDSESSLTQAYDQSGNASATSVEISEAFGRYAIQKVLGQGAMGAVYLARDTQLDRDVALKIPKFGDGNGVDEEELLARFYREARAAATLRSPNICPVYDVGEINGQHYITMAFIEGRPLKDYTKSRKTHSEKQIITTIRKLALGLAEAHEIGVIHRDLKPANIMVDLKGEPVVMDFGLARRSSSDDVQVTQSGAIIGTPAYMAPEQVAGDQAAIDHQVDIYALGIIMYELITGEMPFKGNLMALLQQIALNNPTKPSELRPDIDPRLEAICLKMIAGDQKQRYQSMTDVATDLQEVLRNPDERHRQAQAKKKGPKPKSLPTAKDESNPALISIDRTKSSVVRMRAKQGKKSSSTGKSTAASKSKSSGPPKHLLIAGGIGGLVLLLALVLFVRPGKQDEQTAAADSVISPSEDVKAPEEKVVEPIVSSPPHADTKGSSASVVELLTSPEYEWTEPVNLGPSVNSDKDDSHPSVSADGLCLLFGSDRSGKGDLFECRRRSINEPWGPAENLSSINTPNSFELYPTLSSDGLTLLFATAQPRKPGTHIGDSDLYQSQRASRDEPWGDAVNLGPAINSPLPEYGGCLSPDGLTLYGNTFGNAKAQGDSSGLNDLWHAHRKSLDDPWEQSVPFGAPVNSHMHDEYPQPLDDGKSFLFLRGWDADPHLHLAEMVEDGTYRVQQIETPEIGPSFWLMADGKTLIYESNRPGGLGGTDLWMIRRVKKTATAPMPAVAPFDEKQAKAHQKAWADYLGESVETTNSIGMKFAVIPPGEFKMGEGNNFVDVTLTKPFRFGVYEVTQGQWKAVMETEPWKGQRDVREGEDIAAAYVNWTDATEFCLELTERERTAGRLREGWEYRLPTEAEWEYACRAGTTTSFWFGDTESLFSEYAWFEENTKNVDEAYAHPVGLKKPNPWGLYDVHGNVREWCSDRHGNRLAGGTDPAGPAAGSSRVYRGGGWNIAAESCRSAFRLGLDPSSPRHALGLRVALAIDMAKSVNVDHDSSQTIDLLADLVPATLNSDNMKWQMQEGILTGSSTASREKKEWVGATFPQEISGDYDFELELKQSGFAPLQVDLPLGDDQAIRLHLGGLGCALMQIDGKADRDADPQYRNEDARLKRNAWQRLTAKVRHHDENISVDVALDGERIGQFSGLRSRITLPKWVKPDPVHVKFAGTGNLGTLQMEIRRAVVLIGSQAAMEIDQTKPK